MRALLALVAVALVVTAVLFWRGWPRAVEVGGADQGSTGSLLGREDPSATATTPGSVPAATSAAEIVVHVVGRVRRPGIVRLRPGTRVADAVLAAGGLRAGTDPASVNLARPLTDGEQVVVASAQGTTNGSGPRGAQTTSEDASPGSAAGSKLDLNTASAEQLEALDGIGPVLAERIVTYRGEIGRFGSVEDLRQVSGIGPKIFAAISDQVRV